MPHFDESSIAYLAAWVLAMIIGWYLFRRFAASDSRQLSEQQREREVVIVTSYTLLQNKVVNAFQNAVVLSVYGIIFFIGLSVAVVAFGLSPFDGFLPLVTELVFGSIVLYSKIVVIGTGALFVQSLYIASKRLISPRQIPNYLFSRKYSLVYDLYIDIAGIDGAFCLPWQKVYRCEKVGDTILTISYRRFPRLLSRLVRADTLVISFANTDERERIFNLFTAAKT